MSKIQDASTEPPRRQEQRKAQTRAAILAAAGELFHERGFTDTSTRDIAAHAGIGEGTMYGHFPSKDDILLEVIRERRRDATRRAAAVLVETERAHDRLRIILRRMAEFCADERRLLLPALTVTRNRPQPYEPGRPSSYPQLQAVMDTLESGIAASEFAPVPVEAAARSLVALYQNAAFQIGPWAGRFDRDRTLDELDQILDAWLKPPAQA